MSTCPIIAIDPGNTQSGYCVIDRSTLRPLEFGKIDNAELLQKLSSARAQGWRWAVIEMVASYGMSVGREVFDTVLWIAASTKPERLLPSTAAVPHRGEATHLPQHPRQ